MNVLIKRCSGTAIIPKRATEGSAGYDLFADCDEITINPHKVQKIPTGIAISISADTAALIYARSGLAAKSMIAPINCVGVVDSDYRGEISVALANHSDAPFTVRRGERVAQLVFTPILAPTLIEADSLDLTDRGGGGFGSTGIK